MPHENKLSAPPSRSRPAHFPPTERFNKPTILFITVCAKSHCSLLANDTVHALLRSAWIAAGKWSVGRYMIMPDHVHFFCAPGEIHPCPIGAWIKFWKSLVSRQWPEPTERPVFQRDFWDTQIRSGDHYSEKWSYTELNPVRKGLVAQPDAWPFQGEITRLGWH